MIKRGRVRIEVLKDIAKDLDIQKAIIDDLSGPNKAGRPGKMELKERLLKALIHKTEVNLELLKLV